MENKELVITITYQEPDEVQEGGIFVTFDDKSKSEGSKHGVISREELVWYALNHIISFTKEM